MQTVGLMDVLVFLKATDTSTRKPSGPACFNRASGRIVKSINNILFSLVHPALQPLWSPELCEAADVGTEVATPQSSSPDKCAFCHAVVPQDRMNSHLYSHFSPKNEGDN